jgi:hypothetical protein
MRSFLFALSFTASLLTIAPSSQPARLLASLVSLWDTPQQTQRLPTKEGCGMDPDGRCLPSTKSQPQQIDAGCGMDPSGRCRTSS